MKNRIIAIILVGVLTVICIRYFYSYKMVQSLHEQLESTKGDNGKLYELVYACQQQYENLNIQLRELMVTDLNGEIIKPSDIIGSNSQRSFFFFEEGHCDQCLDIQFELIHSNDVVIIGVFDRIINFKAYLKRKGMLDKGLDLYFTTNHPSENLKKMNVSYYLTLNKNLISVGSHIPMKDFPEITQSYIKANLRTQ